MCLFGSAAKLFKSSKFVQRAQYLQKFPLEVALPEKIKTVIGISQLDLSENEITAIPTTIELLVNLTEVSLRHNRITAVPPELALLSRLERLDLSYNLIDTFPSFERAAALRHLILNHNHLALFPPALHKLPKLELVDVASNKLGDHCWPRDLDWAKMSALERLDLGDNTLDALPPGYEFFSSPQYTRDPLIVFCKSANCCYRISALPALRELRVQGNKLDTVPTDVHCRHFVRYLKSANARSLCTFPAHKAWLHC